MSTQGIISKVAKLLAMAEDPACAGAEAAAFHAKAQELMRQYRIEEEALIATDQVEIEPIMAELLVCSGASEFGHQYLNLASYCAHHAGVRASFTYGRDADGAYGLSATLVGYEGDVRLAEWVYASARIVFAERIEPAVDRSLTDEQNVYRLRSAGITRREVAAQLWGQDTHAAHARVAKIYKAESAARGTAPALDGRGISAAQYRDAYASAFTTEFYWRLRAARDAADSVGGPLVLHGRQERVDEAFYTLFPEQRPSTEVASVEKDVAKPSKPKARRPSPKKDEESWRRFNSVAAQAGRDAGRSAAAEVELDRASNARRLDEPAASALGAIEG